MRTTITVDEDVAAELRKLQTAQRQPFKAVVNQVLRAGLAALGSRRKGKAPAYRTEPVSLGRPRLTNVDNISEVLAFAEGEDHR